MQNPIPSGTVAPYVVPVNLAPRATPVVPATKSSTVQTQAKPLIIDADAPKPAKCFTGSYRNLDSMHADRLSFDRSQTLLMKEYSPDVEPINYQAPRIQSSRAPQAQDAHVTVNAMKRLIEFGTAEASVLVQSDPSALSNSNGATSLPPAVKVVRDPASRVRAVHMRNETSTYVFEFDDSGDLTSLEVKGPDGVSEVTRFSTSGLPVSKEINSIGFTQITTFDKLGRRRTQRSILPQYQEHILFSSIGEVSSKVRQTKEGYELFNLRPDGSTLHQRDDNHHYSRYELMPNGSSFSVFIHKRLRVSARCWFNSTSGTTELIESIDEIVQTKRDLEGNIIFRSSRPKGPSQAISCTP